MSVTQKKRPHHVDGETWPTADAADVAWVRTDVEIPWVSGSMLMSALVPALIADRSSPLTGVQRC